MSDRHLKTAFTLIELLVVIGIIAILVALLFPALSIVEERANKSKCLSNVHQMAVAGSTLFGDLGKELPGRSSSIMYGEACEQLMPYVKYIKEVFDCPGQPGILEPAFKMPSYDYYVDYEINGYLCQLPWTQRNQSLITDYSLAAYAFDIYYWDYVRTAHQGGINVGYLDGHAAWLPEDQLLYSSTNETEKFYCRGHVVVQVEQGL